MKKFLCAAVLVAFTGCGTKGGPGGNGDGDRDPSETPSATPPGGVQPDSGTPPVDPPDSGTPVDPNPPDSGVPLPTVSYSTDIQPLWASCTFCHGAVTPRAGLLLTGTAAETHARLVGVPAAGLGCGASGLPRVKPSSIAESALWLKVSDDPAKCGQAMPPAISGLPKLSADALAKIKLWIEGGALND